jgi:hypothetical protein
MSFEVLQIVSGLPPAINGVGDYAHLLARELNAAHQINTHFLVCNSSQKCGKELDRFQVTQLESLQCDNLESQLSRKGMPQIVLLHYVGYGYQKRGCPFWLKRGLESWRRAGANRRLVIMFHELYAFGPPWRSSFWTSPSQRWLTAGLAKLADHCITNVERYAGWLETHARKHLNLIDTIPVFSNVGEINYTRQLDSRPRNMVIFGSANRVLELLGKYQPETLRCCLELGIEKIITIGCPAGTVTQKMPIPVTETGFLEASRVAEIISSSRVGVTNYFPGYLAKSGVFAAYAALGALPLLPRLSQSAGDGCSDGKNFLFLDQITSRLSDDSLQQVADNAWEWYQHHNLSRTGATYARLLKSVVSSQ